MLYKYLKICKNNPEVRETHSAAPRRASGCMHFYPVSKNFHLSIYKFNTFNIENIDGPHSQVQRIGEPHDRKFFYDHLRSVSLELNN